MIHPTRCILLVAALASLAACTTTAPPNAATLPAAGPATKSAATAAPDRPTARKDSHGQPDLQWLQQHDACVARARQGNVDLYFVGDAITARWNDAGQTVWQKEFAPWNPANFAIGGDKTQHILWRLQNGELDGLSPRAFVVMAGANNHADAPQQTANGIAAILHTIHDKNPHAKILLLAILPRKTPEDPARRSDDAVNALLPKIAAAAHARFLNPSDAFLHPNGALREDLIAKDQTYLTEQGYQVLATAIKPILSGWLKPKGSL